MSGGQKSLKLDRVPYVAEVEYILAYVSSLSEDGHTVEVTNSTCVVEKKNCMVGVGKRAGETYSVKLQC